MAARRGAAADGLVTAVCGIALGVLAADCAPVLFYDPVARIVGAAHGGWRGALGGVVDATVARMTELGAERHHIRAAIGPCIAQPSYEVGAEFPQPFLAEDPGSAGVFCRGAARWPIFCSISGAILRTASVRAGIATVEIVPHDTLAEERTVLQLSACLSAWRALLRARALGDCARGIAAMALRLPWRSARLREADRSCPT